MSRPMKLAALGILALILASSAGVSGDTKKDKQKEPMDKLPPGWNA